MTLVKSPVVTPDDSTAIAQFDRRRFRDWKPPSWARDAACAGRIELYFAPVGERPSTRLKREVQARLICLGCEVRLDCRDHGRRFAEAGIWGGENEFERRAVARRNGQASGESASATDVVMSRTRRG